MNGTKASRKPPQSDGFTKWLRSGGIFSRWWKEALITTPIIAIMAFYGFLRERVDFSWPIYLGFTALASAGISLYFAFNSLKRHPKRESVLEPSAPEFGEPIEPK